MVWFTMALGAAICWGLSYALSDHILKNQMAVPIYLLITSAVGTVLSTLLVLFTDVGRQGWTDIMDEPGLAVGPAFNACLFFIGTVLVYSAIQMHNATSVGFVEISYPFFTAFFAMWLFGQGQLTANVLIGAVLVVAGLVAISRG
jgi:drug/metabolite transporter (DMT)-like permease